MKLLTRVGVADDHDGYSTDLEDDDDDDDDDD